MRLFDRIAGKIRALDQQTFGVSFVQYHRLLRKEIVGHCETLLDIGCGENSPIHAFSRELRHSVGVDSHQPSIAKSRAAGIHSDYRQINVLDVEHAFEAKSFDCVVALDVIEHLTREDGARLLAAMERIARRRAIVFTPNGFLPQPAEPDNPHQLHVSGWTAAEMRERGYRVIGVGGWKPLRGPYAIARRPRLLLERLSLLSERRFETRADRAFQILCIKDLA